MSEWDAILLGVVEGLTEYLPVSSTGHLILTQRLLGIPENEAANAYAICIQSGAILAVLGIYRQRLSQMVRGCWIQATAPNSLTTDNRDGVRLAVNTVVAFMPAAVIGLLFDDLIEEVLFSLWYTVFAWLVGGLAILAVALRYRNKPSDQVHDELVALTWRGALVIGFIQCIAMWPGTSRSLVTIVGGLLIGLGISAAVEFSFLLGVVTLLAATVYKMKDAGPIMMETYGLGVMLLGSVAAWISAVVAVKWMVSYLKRNGMEIFGYYRVLLAIAVAWALWTQRIMPG